MRAESLPQIDQRVAVPFLSRNTRSQVKQKQSQGLSFRKLAGQLISPQNKGCLSLTSPDWGCGGTRGLGTNTHSLTDRHEEGAHVRLVSVRVAVFVSGHRWRFEWEPERREREPGTPVVTFIT